MAKEYTDKQRDRILAGARSFLEDQGIDVDQLEKEAAQQRAARRAFSKPLREGVSSKFKFIPLGNAEFRAVGKKGGGLAPRCQARSRNSSWRQCNAIATTGFRVCRRHGAASHGSKTAEGIKRSAAHLIQHGQETRALRKRRSEAAKERKILENHARENGMWIAPSVRGPYKSDLKTYQKNRAKRISRMMKEFEEAIKRRVVAV